MATSPNDLLHAYEISTRDLQITPWKYKNKLYTDYYIATASPNFPKMHALRSIVRSSRSDVRFSS